MCQKRGFRCTRGPGAAQALKFTTLLLKADRRRLREQAHDGKAEVRDDRQDWCRQAMILTGPVPGTESDLAPDGKSSVGCPTACQAIVRRNRPAVSWIRHRRQGIASLLLSVASVGLAQHISTTYAPASEARSGTQSDAELPPFPANTLADLEALESLGPAPIDRVSELAAHNAAGALPLQDGFARPLENPEHVKLDHATMARIPLGRFGRGLIDRTATDTVFVYRLSVASADALRAHVSAIHLPLGSRIGFWVDTVLSGGQQHAYKRRRRPTYGHRFSTEMRRSSRSRYLARVRQAMWHSTSRR